MGDNLPVDADDVLVARAADRLAKQRECQLLASLITQLRERNRPWWTSAALKKLWPTPVRFQWFDARPDLRARLTHELTGFTQRAARESERSFQAELIERVVDSGDVSVEAWERAFSAEDLAVHAPSSALWQAFRDRFPWDGPEPADRELLVWLFGELLEERKEGGKAASLMTPLYVRSAIDVRVWQEHMPIEVRVQIDGRRLRKELEGKTFTCRDEIAVVKLERLVEHIPAMHLKGVLDALERVLPALGGQADAGSDDETDGEPEQTEAIAKVAVKDVEAH